MNWDLTLLHHINRDWTHPVLDYVMPAISAIEAWVPLLVLIALFAGWRGGTRARWMLLCLALALGIGDGIISKSLKSGVGRVRPRDAMSGVMIRDLGRAKPGFMRLFKEPISKVSKTPDGEIEPGKSFPSSHTVNLFAAATVVAMFFRGWGVGLYILAFAVAWSRIYVGAHWPSDIPPSAGLGIVIGWAVVAAMTRWVPGFSRPMERPKNRD